MTASLTTSSNSSLDHVSHQIEALQAGFRKLSKAATLKDLGRQLAEAVGGMFDHATIDLAYQPAKSDVWEDLVKGSAEGLEKLHGHPTGAVTAASEIHVAPGALTVLHRLADKSLIALAVTGKSHAQRFSDLDILSLRLFATLFDNAYQDMRFRRSEKGLIFSLNHRILQLNSLIDTGIEVSTLDENAYPHRLALVRAASLTNASKGVVRVKRGRKLIEEYVFPEGTKRVHAKTPGTSITTNFSFLHDTYTFELIEKESRSGTFEFEDTDQLLLDALARQVHASLENRDLHRQALEKQRIEQEMSVAATIQKRIIPLALPQIRGYDVAGKNIPSKFVGGDYYDCIPLRDGRYALVIADVTGKGVPAALLVSSLHAYLSAYLEIASSLSELLGKLNKALCNATTDDKFVTAFIALLSPDTGEIEYSSAGHNPAYILRSDGKVDEINIGGPPLGALDIDFPFLSGSAVLGKGERLLLYTDGVTEAMNEKNEMYEQAISLSGFLAGHAPSQAETFITDLIADIARFVGAAPQSDDITVLYLCRKD